MTLELEAATAFSEEMIRNIESKVLKVEVSGEIRRKCSEVNTVSLVVIPRQGVPFIEKGDSVVIENGVGEEEHLWKLGGIVCRPIDGSRTHAKMETIEDKITIELWIARMHFYQPVFTPGNFGSVLLYSTGPDKHRNHIVSRANHLGFTWEWQHGISDAKGLTLAGETEKEIYSALKLDFVEPEER
jgi:DNA polymerase/3'-5' exonuclease PolX